jgi:hypothetical protein
MERGCRRLISPPLPLHMVEREVGRVRLRKAQTAK